jgi:hypothetical protein
VRQGIHKVDADRNIVTERRVHFMLDKSKVFALKADCGHDLQLKALRGMDESIPPYSLQRRQRFHYVARKDWR